MHMVMPIGTLGIELGNHAQEYGFDHEPARFRGDFRRIEYVVAVENLHEILVNVRKVV